jgi:uncharacterized protein (TIGR00251 family)
MVRDDRDGGGVLVAIRVKPRAGQARIAGRRAERVLVDVTAPPLEGRANEAACRVIAKALGIAPGLVTVVGGQRARDKLVRVQGCSPARVAKLLGVDQVN